MIFPDNSVDRAEDTSLALLPASTVSWHSMSTGVLSMWVRILWGGFLSHGTDKLNMSYISVCGTITTISMLFKTICHSSATWIGLVISDLDILSDVK